MKERISYPQHLWEHGQYFFIAPIQFEESVVTKKWNADAIKVLTAYREAIEQFSQFDATFAKAILEQVTSKSGIGTGKILQALRLSITGLGGGPDLMMIMEIIGKDEVVKRISYALENIKIKVG